jgi:hypothetical protein
MDIFEPGFPRHLHGLCSKAWAKTGRASDFVMEAMN